MPRLEYGARFTIRSVRGSTYTLTLLAHGEHEAGLYVRLDDGRTARLDPHSLDWSSYTPNPDPSLHPLREGDDLVLSSPSGTLRGTLLEPFGEELALRLPIGSDLRLPRSEIDQLFLMFRARDLKAGDHVHLSSLSGNVYQGQVVALQHGRRLKLMLHAGTEANLRLSKVNLTSLLVMIPLRFPQDTESAR